MSLSDDIRTLGRDGAKPADIARQLGIKYQHAYTVLKAAGLLSAAESRGMPTRQPQAVSLKPALSVAELTRAGFELSGYWRLSSTGELTADRPLPKAVGVYAFAQTEVVMYVGVATMGLSKRLYFYGRPGVTQRTSLRLNDIIKSALQTIPSIAIYTAVPPDLEWNGLPIHGSAGLELGLIKKYALPWNMRSSG